MTSGFLEDLRWTRHDNLGNNLQVGARTVVPRDYLRILGSLMISIQIIIKLVFKICVSKSLRVSRTGIISTQANL